MQTSDLTTSDPAFRCLGPEEALAYVVGGAAGTSSPSRDPGGIQAHIDDCDGCRLVLAEAARSALANGSATVAPFRTLVDGQQLLGRYEIRRFIARGGMGEVYEAFDSVLGERVALKTLLPTALDDQRAIQRLADEVRLARKVTHRNVCRILEFGVYHRGDPRVAGLPFLTMEFLAGEPLSRRIAAGGTLAPVAIVKLISDVTAGLAAIHAAGVVHRDFKTENVFLAPDAAGERAVITDFGLARGLGDDRRRCSSTAAAGTPDYMAPEQVEGKPPTPAFDIYALGVVLFELLTGQKPFAGTSPYMAALSRLQRRAPAPSTLVPELGPAWDAIVGRCLERQPERRFARVEDVAAALPAVSIERPAGRTRRTALLTAGIAVVAVTAVVQLARSERHAPPPVAAVRQQPAPATAPPPAPVTPPPAPVALPPAKLPPRTPRARSATPARPPAPATPPALATPSLDDAEALMLAGEVQRGCALGEQVAATQPSLAAAQRFLGKCYIRLGDSVNAHQHYRRYLQLAPDAPDAVFIRGILERR